MQRDFDTRTASHDNSLSSRRRGINRALESMNGRVGCIHRVSTNRQKRILRTEILPVVEIGFRCGSLDRSSTDCHRETYV